MERSGLILLEDISLENSELSIISGKEQRLFTLLEVAGRGMTAVTWKARGSNGQLVAIKFTRKREFADHSLDLEVEQVNAIRSDYIAQILAFGTPSFEQSVLPEDGDQLSAIVVEWHEGPTLAKYIQGQPALTIDAFLHFAHSLCSIAEALVARHLLHNDLHDGNIIVRTRVDAVTGESTFFLVAIDTGQLKSETVRLNLLTKWAQAHSTLISQANPDQQQVERNKSRIAYFSRTDLEWCICHLCALYNALRTSPAARSLSARRFLKEIPETLQRAVHPDAAQRYGSPSELFRALDACKARAYAPSQSELQSPFDLVSAEMIRSDRDLMELFEESYPRIRELRGAGATYVYGPRGCGKSTLLRAMSCNAILASRNAEAELAKVSFLGVYISCSQELRTRFWLADEAALALMTPQLVRYFTLLLLYELAFTLANVFDWDKSHPTSSLRFGMTLTVAHDIAAIIRERVALTATRPVPSTSNPFERLKLELILEQDVLWKAIVSRRSDSNLVDAQAIFDIAKRLAERWPFLQEKRLAFLLDDYSNQRIPAALQRQLNQVITFSRQKSPIFKVTSEYKGLELDGIDAGREVQEVNIGDAQTTPRGSKRSLILERLLEKRFHRLGTNFKAREILGRSRLEPSIQMARAIKAAHESGQDFYYHGIDTIFDVCSGNLALAIEIVRLSFVNARTPWAEPKPIAARHQHAAITELSSRTFDYIRFRSIDGNQKWMVATALCQLARTLTIDAKTRKKASIDKKAKVEPRVQTHIDIADSAIQQLPIVSPSSDLLFTELIRRGVLLALRDSREGRKSSGTKRFMISRILLAKFIAPLGRDVPFKIDNEMRLQTLLLSPADFAQSELLKVVPEPKRDSAPRLPFGE